eukprot:573331-Hanusia_phi.AAC.1
MEEEKRAEWGGRGDEVGERGATLTAGEMRRPRGRRGDAMGQTRLLLSMSRSMLSSHRSGARC